MAAAMIVQRIVHRLAAASKTVSAISRAGPKSRRSWRSTTSSGSMTDDTVAADMRGRWRCCSSRLSKEPLQSMS